jgi:hypothetical protein
MLAPVLIALAPLAAGISPNVECEQSIAKVAGTADGHTRVVITFTADSQHALLPLYESPGTGLDLTMFPIARDQFVLTLQLYPPQSSALDMAAFAKGVCAVGLSSGARFNGILAFRREYTTSGGHTLTRENMIAAEMAELPKK